MSNVTVGDTVMWRGGFGSQPPETAVVRGLEITPFPDGKEGDSVNEVPWSLVDRDLVIFDLENGHWAYSSQISKV